MASIATASTSHSVGNQHESYPLPSLSTEDNLGDDLKRPLDQNHFNEANASRNIHIGKSKDKGKRRASPDYDEDDPDVPSPTTGAIDETFNPAMISLEPLEDDETETRRIEENLRQWEHAERQRRKAARTSASLPPGSGVAHTPSLVSEVASFFWAPRFSTPQHAALRSRESMDVPLANLSPRTVSPADSRAPTPTQDPFANPPTHSPSASPTTPKPSILPSTTNDGKRPTSVTAAPIPISPFDDAHQVAVPSPTTPGTQLYPSQSRLRPPPPLPLGLPPPRTPPPQPIGPHDSPSVTTGEDDVRETRWWHEWLCGCGEGPDRGGDYQAGRTNPFE